MNPSILLILLYIESSLFFFLRFFITNTPMIDKVANITIPNTIEEIIISNL